MPEVTYRRLQETSEDLELVFDFLTSTFVQEHQMGPLSAVNFSPKKSIPFLVAAIQCGAWIAEYDGKIVGSIGLQVSAPWYAEINYISDLWLYVIPEYRKHGVAGSLIEIAEAESSEKGLPLMLGLFNDVDVDKKMEFLKGKGFRMVGAQFLKVQESE